MVSEHTVFQEKYGCLGVENIYLKSIGQNNIVRLDKSAISGEQKHSNVIIYLKQFFTEVFLPQGYPFSVSDDYWSYQVWDTIQAFCSTICGTLTTHAIMKGVGVGDTAATPLAAAVTWILKDGTGMLGRIVFAWWKGSRLDAECKAWRLVADILNDLAMLAEMILPYVPYFSTYILCASQSAKAIVGVAGGATRAAITQHQAIRGNTGDVSAKDGSQEMCVNLVASFVGIFLLTTVSNAFYVWLLFLTFTCLHIVANYKAVLSLKLLTLNTERLNLILMEYLKSGKVKQPALINQQEAVFPGFGLTTKQLCGFDVHLGCSLQQCLNHNHVSEQDLLRITKQYQNSSYVLVVDTQSSCIYVMFRENEAPKNVIQAYFHAISLAIVHSLKDGPLWPRSFTGESHESSAYVIFLKDVCLKLKGSHTSINEFIGSSQDVFAIELDRFLAKLELEGWKVDRHHLIVDEWRASWSFSDQVN